MPRLTRRLEIDYTGPELRRAGEGPVQVQARGQDPEWTGGGQRPPGMQYTNLPPRKYRFRVIACNNSGVWNETGDTLEFSIARRTTRPRGSTRHASPPFWPCSGGCTGCGYIRSAGVQRAVGRARGRATARRARAARYAAAELSGRADPDAGRAQSVIPAPRKGRAKASRRPSPLPRGPSPRAATRSRTCASSTVTKNDLARALRLAGDQMAAQGSARFEVRVQGSSRDVHPILRDEVYRIALEAMRNAFKHAER